MKKPHVLVLWDESHLWGVLLLNALKDLGLSCFLINSVQITQGRVLGKSGQNGLLLVPGGGARLKAKRLGASGIAAIKQWVREGGNYFGICGGAGLALSHPQPQNGIGLCQLKRAAFSNRIDHLLSGHVNARVDGGKIVPLPIWWPGRFEASANANARILAAYESPAQDLLLADKPLLGPAAANGDVHCAIADFPAGQPLILYGSTGKGSYLLSYSHLETPESPAANFLFASFLRDFFDIDCAHARIKTRNFLNESENADSNDSFKADMLNIWRLLKKLITAGFAMGLFFPRLPWLVGWKQGAPGIILNHLLCQFHYLTMTPASRNAEMYWQDRKNIFLTLFREFYHAANIFFQRLPENGAFPDLDMQKANLEKQRVFGHPMLGGGMAGQLLEMTENLFFLAHQQANVKKTF